MTEALAPANGNAPAAAVEAVLVRNDLRGLTEEQRLAYYRQVCDSLGLNPLTQPFAYLELNGKLRLYALRACTDQLRKLHGVSVTSVTCDESEGLYTVMVKVRDANGRQDEDIGCVNTAGLKGEALANARMRALTKAKRRATLSLCGLGWLDESELDTVPEARREPAPAPVPAPRQIAEEKPKAPPAPRKPAEPKTGPELLVAVDHRDAYLARRGLIAAGDLQGALDYFCSTNSFSDAADEWTPEQVAAALEHLRGWEQELQARRQAAPAG